MAELGDAGLAVEVDGVWTLTEPGVPLAQEQLKGVMRKAFGEGLVRKANSATYAEYCRRVYGDGTFHFNMVDNPQLERLLAVAEFGPEHEFVDLGCAVGGLTASIAARTGARGLGLDFADPVVEFARRVHGSDRLTFEVGDLEELDLPAVRFDAALCIDTLYFPRDLDQTVGDILACLKPGGRLVAFFSVSRNEDQPEKSLEADDSLLAAALRHHGVSYEVEEFTELGHALWRRARVAADSLKQAWLDEGYEADWRSRDKETACVLARYDEGRSRRYLYTAQLGADV